MTRQCAGTLYIGKGDLIYIIVLGVFKCLQGNPLECLKEKKNVIKKVIFCVIV